MDKIWTDMSAGGITNPLTVIEQLTYLIFIKTLDDKELENESFEAVNGKPMPRMFDEQTQDLRWSKFKNKHPKEMYEIVGTRVFPFIKNLEWKCQFGLPRYMDDAMFLFPTSQVFAEDHHQPGQNCTSMTSKTWT